MTDDARYESGGHQYVVYTLDANARPSYFIAVADSYDEAVEEMERWWKAFASGEKRAPSNYEGVSFQHVSQYDEWEEGDNGHEGFIPDTDPVEMLRK